VCWEQAAEHGGTTVAMVLTAIANRFAARNMGRSSSPVVELTAPTRGSSLSFRRCNGACRTNRQLLACPAQKWFANKKPLDRCNAAT
jgi:hypothetical protein